jgi:glycosyltransferase involved in cell wall biosynthesis
MSAASPENQSPLFSIVMPTYGVERYIADAIADILTQTFRDFELIIVDDCTPDRSIEVAQAVAGDDPRVRIVHHEVNRGLSAARNTGIDEARGLWVLFPDPDDRYEPSMLECVYAALKQPTDLVVFGHVQEYYGADGSFLYDNTIPMPETICEQGSDLAHLALELEQLTHLGYAWNKAYRLEQIRTSDLFFEDNVPLIEDILFNVAYLRTVNTVTTIPDVLYRYAKRLGTNLTNDFVPGYYELHRRRISEIRDFVEERGALDEEAKALLGALYARFILSSIEQNTNRKSGMNHKDRIAWLERLFQEPLFNELVTCAHAQDSTSLALCIRLLNARNITSLLALGQIIHVVRTRSTTLYTKVKSHR